MRAENLTRKGKNTHKKMNFFTVFWKLDSRLHLTPTDVLLVSQIDPVTRRNFFSYFSSLSSWTLFCCVFVYFDDVAWIMCSLLFVCMIEGEIFISNGGFYSVNFLLLQLKGWKYRLWEEFLVLFYWRFFKGFFFSWFQVNFWSIN